MQHIKSIISLIIICVCLISLGVYLKYRKQPPEKTNTENVTLSIEQINALQVYDMTCNKDAQKLFYQVGESLWENEVTKAEFTDEEYRNLTGNHYHDYTLQLRDGDGSRSLSGVTSLFSYSDDRQSEKKKFDGNKKYITEQEQEKYVKQFASENRLGVWQGNTWFSEGKKYGQNQIRIITSFDGIPCTEYLYNNSPDGKEYMNDTMAKFIFGVTGDLRRIEDLSSYEITGVRNIGKQYSYDEEFNEYLEKGKIRYCFIEKKDSMEGHICAVPILELPEELYNRNTDAGKKFTSSVSVGINLDTGETIGIGIVTQN